MFAKKVYIPKLFSGDNKFIKLTVNFLQKKNNNDHLKIYFLITFKN